MDVAGGFLSLSLKDQQSLYEAYMPFLKYGGIFYQMPQITYHMGDEVFLVINIMNEPEPLPVAGKVAWMTPSGVQGKPVGIGIQFNEEAESVCKIIEIHLAGKLGSNLPTHTI
jgi:type IV pilus assembly protein PilZ